MINNHHIGRVRSCQIKINFIECVAAITKSVLTLKLVIYMFRKKNLGKSGLPLKRDRQHLLLEPKQVTQNPYVSSISPIPWGHRRRKRYGYLQTESRPNLMNLFPTENMEVHQATSWHQDHNSQTMEYLNPSLTSQNKKIPQYMNPG